MWVCGSIGYGYVALYGMWSMFMLLLNRVCGYGYVCALVLSTWRESIS